ncbi:hypothetical protein ACYUJ6_14895 [Clostridium sp. JNZ X4-2]
MYDKNINGKPKWLKVSYNKKSIEEISLLMEKLSLNTVCREANCPIWENVIKNISPRS